MPKLRQPASCPCCCSAPRAVVAVVAAVNGAEPAFPSPGFRGLTKREHVATQLLAGMLAGQLMVQGGPLGPRALETAQLAVALADVLLLELAKGGNDG